MRIFDTYTELRTALDLPALAPGAYRFANQYGRAGFVCAGCGVVRLFPVDSFSTGYGKQHGQFFCFDCCTAGDLARLEARPAVFYAYLSGDRRTVSNWPGRELARVTQIGHSRAGWHGAEIWRFRAVDKFGQWWTGRGAGPGMCCTLRPMKDPHEKRPPVRACIIDVYSPWGTGRAAYRILSRGREIKGEILTDGGPAIGQARAFEAARALGFNAWRDHNRDTKKVHFIPGAA